MFPVLLKIGNRQFRPSGAPNVLKTNKIFLKKVYSWWWIVRWTAQGQDEMANLFQCQYVRACILNSYKEFHSADTTGKYQNFNCQFGFDMSKKDFVKYSKRFIEYSKKLITGLNKAEMLKNYSTEAWEMLDEFQRRKHSLRHCLGCNKNVNPDSDVSQLLGSASAVTPSSSSSTTFTPSSSSAVTPLRASTFTPLLNSTPVDVPLMISTASTIRPLFGYTAATEAKHMCTPQLSSTLAPTSSVSSQELSFTIEVPLPEKNRFLPHYEKEAFRAVMNQINPKWQQVTLFISTILLPACRLVSDEQIIKLTVHKLYK